MDNVTAPSLSIKSCAIRLNQLEYSAYQQGCLEIRSPKNKMLSILRRNLSPITEDDAIFQLWAQACLLEVLFDQIEGKVKLPQKAITSVVRIIDRIDVHLKKQMSM